MLTPSDRIAIGTAPRPLLTGITPPELAGENTRVDRIVPQVSRLAIKFTKLPSQTGIGGAIVGLGSINAGGGGPASPAAWVHLHSTRSKSLSRRQPAPRLDQELSEGCPS